MLLRVTAVTFHHFMGSGRTSPVLCGCEDDLGIASGDFVIKLRGGLDRGVTGLTCELVASRLATHFGLAVPEPALVMIDADFAELVASLGARDGDRIKADRIHSSVGMNFGTRMLSGANTWPVDKWIPEALWQAAANLFCFDAFIQNPDRRFNNTNLLTRGNELFLFDHELAFSFLLDIFASATPWRLDEQPYLSDHVFYRPLKSKVIDITGFAEALTTLSGPTLDGILNGVPPEWNNGSLTKIEQHVRTVSAHAAEFAEEIKRRLA